MSSSLRSSNFKVVKIAPEISFSSNFSTIDGSKPASYIHLATCRGVHIVTSLKFKLSTASVNELRGRWRAGISGTRGAISNATVCGIDGLGVTGDMARLYSSSSWKSIDESTELRNKCGPLGPSTAALAARPKSKPLNSLEFGLGVCTSSNEDIVVPLCRPLEFTLSRGELLSSISLSSSKSVSNISVASDIGRAANCFMLKNASVGRPLWNISTRGSMGVVGECLGILPDVEWGYRWEGKLLEY
jgi:hypothetical protein